MRSIPKDKIGPESDLTLEVKRNPDGNWYGLISEEGQTIWSIHSPGSREHVLRRLLEQVGDLERPRPVTRIECNDENGSLYRVVEPIQTVADRLAEGDPFAWFEGADGGEIAIRPESVLALVELDNG